MEGIASIAETADTAPEWLRPNYGGISGPRSIGDVVPIGH